MTLAGTLFCLAILAQGLESPPVTVQPFRETAAPQRTPIPATPMTQPNRALQRTPVPVHRTPVPPMRTPIPLQDRDRLQAEGSVRVAVHAILATREPRQTPFYDPAVESMRHALSDLDFNCYRRVKSSTVDAPFAQDTPVPVNERYTLYLQPMDRVAAGRTRLTVRVEMAGRALHDPPRIAMAPTVVMAHSKMVKLRGLKMPEGELVILLVMQ